MDNLITGAGVYFVIWWLVIFMVLPFGVHRIDEEDAKKGQSAGAPKRPLLVRKLQATTVLSAVMWVVLYFIIDTGIISIRGD